MWKKWQLLCLMAIPSIVLAQPEGYVDPVTFMGTYAEKTQVMKYIKATVYETFCEQRNECSPSTLYRMEKADFAAFKYLTIHAKRNESAYDRIYEKYCLSLGECRYHTLKMKFIHEGLMSTDEPSSGALRIRLNAVPIVRPIGPS